MRVSIKAAASNTLKHETTSTAGVSSPPSPLRCQVLRYLPEKQRYTLELLEPPAGGGGAGKRMDVRPANFVLAHLPAGTRCARARRLHWLPPLQSGVRQECFNQP